MPITYQIDSERKWVEMRLSGEVSMEEAQAAITRMFRDPAYSDDLTGVIDCREMTNVWKLNEVRELADMQLARPGPSWRSRRAVVVSSPEHYNTAHLFMVFVEAGPVQYSIFYSIEAAMQWLRE